MELIQSSLLGPASFVKAEIKSCFECGSQNIDFFGSEYSDKMNENLFIHNIKFWCHNCNNIYEININEERKPSKGSISDLKLNRDPIRKYSLENKQKGICPLCSQPSKKMEEDISGVKEYICNSCCYYWEVKP